MRPSTTLGLLALTTLTTAHTVFTTLFINSANQGDGTCIRMPRDPSLATHPVRPVTTTNTDLVCGRDGLSGVPFTCPAPAGAKLTFEFRTWADASQPGSIDPSHKGPCAVYLKQVVGMATSRAEGDGWFKIWEDGYDEASGRWCTERLIADNGLLSVALPDGLPTGYFLVRTEILSLQVADKGDPQFYVGCAQVFVQGAGSGTLDVPADRKVAIPGHVKPDDKGVAFNIWLPKMELPYPIPGPEVWFPTLGGGKMAGANAGASKAVEAQGVVPDACLLKNANWCGFEVGSYTDEAGCWNASTACYRQSKACYDTAPPTGSTNCRVWEGKCQGIQDACEARRFTGPPAVKLVAVEAKVPGPIPGVDGSASTTAAAAAAPTSAVANPSVATTSAVAIASSSSTATQPAIPEPTEDTCPGDVVSRDGLCGGDMSQTCSGSEFGGCCSRYGRCGSTKLHCGCGCQNAFGQCN